MFTSTKKLFICSYKTNMYFLIIFCRMEPFHLLEPYYEENHRGRLTAEGEVTTLLLLVIFPLHMYLCSRINLIISILCRNCTLFVLEPMISSRTCGTMTGTLFSLRGLDLMLYHSRFAMGCLPSTPWRSQL